MKNCWISPTGVWNQVMVLRGDSLLVADPGDRERDRLQALAEKGELRAEEVDLKGVVVPLSGIQKVQSNLKTESLEITWKERRGKQDTEYVSFADAAQRDQALEALEAALGPNFGRTLSHYGRPRAAVAPLVAAAVLVGLTLAMRAAAIDIASGASTEVSGRRAFLKRIIAQVLEFLGPWGVTILGGLCVAGTLWWLVKRVADPPVVARLKPGRGDGRPLPRLGARPAPAPGPSPPTARTVPGPRGTVAAPASDTAGWYYETAAIRQGPVGLAELRALVERGELAPHNLVWAPGLREWARVDAVDVLTAPPPPSLAETVA